MDMSRSLAILATFLSFTLLTFACPRGRSTHYKMTITPRNLPIQVDSTHSNTTALHGNPLNPLRHVLVNADLFSKEIVNMKRKYRYAQDILTSQVMNQDSPLSHVFDHKPSDPLESIELSEQVLGGLAGQAHVPVKDFAPGSYDVTYYTEIKLGSDKQGLSFSLDTGSSDLWVPAGCDSCFGDGGVPRPQFDTSMSTTFNPSSAPFDNYYAQGHVYGYVAYDTVSIGGFEIRQQAMGIVTNQYEDVLAGTDQISGLFGLGFKGLSGMGKTTWMERLIYQSKQNGGKGLLMDGFSLHLARGLEEGSELCIGCMNPALFHGPTQWHPVLTRSYWTLRCNGMQIRTGEVIQSYNTIILDSGSTYSYLPSAIAEQFYATVPGAKLAPRYGDGVWSIPCSYTNLQSGFIINNVTYIIDFRDLKLGWAGTDNDCVSSLIGVDFAGGVFLAGDNFLKSWYTTYDYSGGGRVGITKDINALSRKG